MPREGSGGIPGTSPRDPMAAKIENVASRAAGNGARIQNLRAESTRNQVSLLNRVNKTAISRATPVGAPRRGHQSAPVYNRSIIDNLLSLVLLGKHHEY
jgi:hypothetical protein